MTITVACRNLIVVTSKNISTVQDSKMTDNQILNWWDNLPYNWKLTFLKLSKIETEFSGIRKIEKLEIHKLLSSKDSLEIEFNKFITDTSGLLAFTHINSLTIRFCQNLASIEGLKNLIELQRLTIVDCHKIRFIEELGSLNKLQYLNINDTRTRTPRSYFADEDDDGELYAYSKDFYFDDLIQLQEINCKNTLIEKSWVKQFESLHPNCIVKHSYKSDTAFYGYGQSTTFRNSDAFDTPEQYNDFLNDG